MIVFKSIRPATAFKSSIFREEIRNAAQAMALKIKKDFEATTKTWADKPEFKVEVNVGRAAGGYVATKAGTPAGAEISVTTDDEIYGYVDEGTKPHVIRPRRRGGLLAFKTGGYRAKTRPQVIGSTAGRPGKNQVFAKEVHHPGTKARKFTQVIHKKWQATFRKEMDAAIKRAAKRSGHGK